MSLIGLRLPESESVLDDWSSSLYMTVPLPLTANIRGVRPPGPWSLTSLGLCERKTQHMSTRRFGVQTEGTMNNDIGIKPTNIKREH